MKRKMKRIAVNSNITTTANAPSINGADDATSGKPSIQLTPYLD